MDLNVNTSVSTFRALIDSNKFGTRNVVIDDIGSGMKVAEFARAGRCSVTSSAKELNRSTMNAFHEALRNEHGADAVKIFHSVIGDREQRGKALRLKDVRTILDRVATKELSRVYTAGGGLDLPNDNQKLTPQQTKVLVRQERAALQSGMKKVFGENRGDAGYRLAWSDNELPADRTLSARDAGKLFSRMREWDVETVADTMKSETKKFLSKRHPSLNMNNGFIPREYHTAVKFYMRTHIFTELAQNAPVEDPSGTPPTETTHLDSTVRQMLNKVLDDPEAVKNEYETAMNAAKKERRMLLNAKMQELQQIHDTLTTIFG